MIGLQLEQLDVAQEGHDVQGEHPLVVGSGVLRQARGQTSLEPRGGEVGELPGSGAEVHTGFVLGAQFQQLDARLGPGALGDLREVPVTGVVAAEVQLPDPALGAVVEVQGSIAAVSSCPGHAGPSPHCCADSLGGQECDLTRSLTPKKRAGQA